MKSHSVAAALPRRSSSASRLQLSSRRGYQRVEATSPQSQRRVPSTSTIITTTIALLLCFFATAIRAESEVPFAPVDGARFIRFDGLVTSTVWNPERCCEWRNSQTPGGLSASDPACNGTGSRLGPSSSSFLWVGINPVWDRNPFFFELYHLQSELNRTDFAKDLVSDLDFASAAYACYAGGKPCGPAEPKPQYMGEHKLNLTLAKTVKTRMPGTAEDGYSVSGADNTWVAKDSDSYLPGVSIAASSCDIVEADKLLTISSWVNFRWKEGVRFNYTLSFSNSSAQFTISTAVNGSYMNIGFTGARSLEKSTAELDTTDPTQPHFLDLNHKAITSLAPTMAPTSAATSTFDVSSLPTVDIPASTAAAAGRMGSGKGSPFGSLPYVLVMGLLPNFFI